MAFFEWFGLFFDPQSKQSYTKDGDEYVITPFTFENALTNGFPVNPFNFATLETADKIIRRLKIEFPMWNFSVSEVNFADFSGVKRNVPERMVLVVTENGARHLHNLGMLASSVIRVGWRTTLNQFIDEVRLAMKDWED